MVDARQYHEATKHHPDRMGGSSSRMDPALKPRPWKEYRSLTREDLSSMSRIQLPTLSLIAHSSADPSPGVPDSDRPVPDRPMVGSLCYVASGITQVARTDTGETIAFRAASCTGKLYHIDLYLAVGSVTGLPAGLYHFDPHSMALDVLRDDDIRGHLATAVGEESGGVADAPVTVIATSQWWRNAWKYADRAYRHAFWDTGTVLANLLAGAHAFDQQASVVTGFADERIVDLLGIDPTDEAPIAVVPIGSGDRVADPPELEPVDPAVVPVSSDRIEYQQIVDAWRESTLSDGSDATEWRHAVADAPFGGSTAGNGMSLEPVDDQTASARPLDATIRRRGSCREFAERGPSRRQIGTVLDRSLRGVPGDWNWGRGDGPLTLSAYVLVEGTPDIEDGTYHYNPRNRTIDRLGPIDSQTMSRLALGQPWAGQAHVNAYLMADIDSIVERLGNRGYRLAQLEAGITLGRLYLATYAHRELGGTGLTFFDDLVTEHLSPRAAQETPMCLFAFGRAAG